VTGQLEEMIPASGRRRSRRRRFGDRAALLDE